MIAKRATVATSRLLRRGKQVTAFTDRGAGWACDSVTMVRTDLLATPPKQGEDGHRPEFLRRQLRLHYGYARHLVRADVQVVGEPFASDELRCQLLRAGPFALVVNSVYWRTWASLDLTTRATASGRLVFYRQVRGQRAIAGFLMPMDPSLVLGPVLGGHVPSKRGRR